jgi:hypothetical protein
MSHPITRVSVTSTGTVQIRPEHGESNGTPLLWWLNTSRRWTAPRPIKPTPGHTPGSLSLLLRSAGQPDLLLVGDVTYDATLLAAGRLEAAVATHREWTVENR